jgi:hypothetical protein
LKAEKGVLRPVSVYHARKNDAPLQNALRLLSVLLITFFASGCVGSFLKYDDLMIKPSAVQKEGAIDLDIGCGPSSVGWTKTFVKIEDDRIFVSGKLTPMEMPHTLTIKLPDSQKTYRVFWREGNWKDSKTTEIEVRKTEEVGTAATP